MNSISNLKNYKKKIEKSQLAKLVLASISILIAILAFYNLLYLNRIFPGIYVAEIYLGSKTPNEARTLLSSKVTRPESLILTNNDQALEVPTGSLELSYDFEKTVQQAFLKGRNGNLLNDLFDRVNYPFNKVDLPLVFNLDQEKLDSNLSVVAEIVSVEAVNPSASLKDGAVLIERGIPGTDVDLESLKRSIELNFTKALDNPITIPLHAVGQTLNENEYDEFKKRAESLLEKNLILYYQDSQEELDTEKIFKLIKEGRGYKQEELQKTIEKISATINRGPSNPVFVFENGVVKEFAPAKEGFEVEKGKLKGLISDKLHELEASEEKILKAEIPVIATAPEIKTEEVNNLGIKELLGKGSSRFSGSITSRIHNIGLSSSKFNGVLVKPGEIFSFNEILGDVSEYTGYKQAYIIKDGKTVLGDGGGVCQVSTTLFRAILKVGLPIAERRAHSYRVGYYEQDFLPGLDATVYAPTTDLKFVNDTPAHLLIQTKFDPRRASLEFEIYGTSDGRVSETTKPIVTNVTPPPEDLYQDDPSLPTGTIKQIDYKAWGAKVSFNYLVKKGEEIIYQKTFNSNYRPWQAVYLRGTGPAL